MTTNGGVSMSMCPSLALIYLYMEHIEYKDVRENDLCTTEHYNVRRSKQYSRGNKFVPRKDYKVKGVGNLMGNNRTRKRI